ncbi:MAG: YheC/YheD family protein [Firmicutes bacterium]|nr:YheC/YheD family protein [Bacillota bacterium]
MAFSRVDVSARIPDGDVQVAGQLAARWALPDGSRIRLRAGGRRVGARLRVATGEAAAGAPLQLSRRVALKLRLPLPGCFLLRVSRREGRQRPVVSLGPVIGILTWTRAGECRRYLWAARELPGLVFAFTGRDVRWRTRTIRGFGLRGPVREFGSEAARARGRRGLWGLGPYPLPDVVYDRMVGGFGSGGARFLRCLRAHGCAVFNGRIGHKWRIHRQLLACRDLWPWLPPTRPLRTAADVIRLARKFGGVYLKPDAGFGGSGIVRVRRFGPGLFAITASGARTAIATAGGLRSLVARLRRRGRYLIQRELPLIRVRGKICDIRALVARDAAGLWHVAGMAARIGRRGSIASNLKQGGRPVPLERALSWARWRRRPAVEVVRDVQEIALKAARAVTRYAPSSGDLGIDLGLDRRGKVWLLEVNPKPGRRSFDAIGDERVRRRAYALPLEFARYLSGFGQPTALQPD